MCYTELMIDNDKLVAYQDYDGFILIEKTEYGTHLVAEHSYSKYTYAVVGIGTEGERFIIPCETSRDASFEEISAREDGCTEVQTLPIKDIR